MPKTTDLIREAYALRKEADRRTERLHRYNGTPRLLKEREAIQILYDKAQKLQDRVHGLREAP